MKHLSTALALVVTGTAYAQCTFTPTITPDPAITCPVGFLLLETQAYDSYQWFENGQPITGQTFQVIQVDNASVGNSFTVQCTLNGCTEMSAPVVLDGWVFLLPFVILGVVILHVWSLHIPGSSNPTGVEVKSESDTVPFFPYFVGKDGWTIGLFMLIYSAFVFFMPNALGHPDNYVPANPMQTPAHIVPEWYFWPFYAILRAFTVDFLIVPAKLMGVLAMFAAILVWFFLPWLDRSPVRSANYRPLYRKFFWVLVVDVAVLAYCGGAPAEEPFVMISQIASLYYFLHFFVIVPVVSSIERPDPLPYSITEAVLGADDSAKLGDNG